MTTVRKGQAPDLMPRDEFSARFRAQFYDPAFRPHDAAIDALEEIAWDGYREGRKAPLTEKAGPEFADPDYDLSVEWRATRDKVRAADAKRRDASTPSRTLVVCASSRNDGTCPGEMSKSFRLAQVAGDQLHGAGIEVDLLDLSHLASDPMRHIHPCKGCVSTAMPLCHWPCSCYPNHSTRQTNDWMAEIYERWSAAHGVVLVTPVYWYQVTSPLKLMMDRLVCADGGNSDPTRTSGKDAEKAKKIELEGWDYPKHLAGRVYGLIVHGDVAGIEPSRRALSDWLDWMGLIDAGSQARLDRYIGYYEPYATSHDTLDADRALWEEVRNVARAVSVAVADARAGRLPDYNAKLKDPRPK
ncbi:MAG TPA: flavodoxin family protein [Burkholderiales bacterium]|jgi:multimeric flavodoxin WrbA|nr:flavodoxin family protein [Burkholderiales bacterium]